MASNYVDILPSDAFTVISTLTRKRGLHIGTHFSGLDFWTADSAAEVSGAAREKMLKEAALARKKAEATAERIQKQAQAKEEKQRAKESTHGKGVAWLAGCQKKLSDIAGISVQCESTNVDEATRTLYKEKMNGHRQEVVNLRSAIELALGGQDDMVISDGLSKAEAVIEAFKADRQAWNVIYRLATKKAS